MAGPAIELEDVHHTYDREEVLRGIDLTIERGEVFGFLGHNGAGKTTAINILTTLIRPTSGRARVCGFDVVTERHQVASRIGYLPADVRLYGHMTARENLEFFARLSGVDDPRRAVSETLDYLDAAAYADRRVGGFSTGMRQRIGIAQAIVHRPAVLFLDEPTSGLDPMGVRQLRQTIQRLNEDLAMTVFMNTHLLSEVSQVCTTIGVLNHGELIYKDSIAETTRRFPDERSLEDIYVRMEALPAAGGAS
ncbi:MAG: ABC transporter ATP-binding protein [Acidimicrobiales bacterium]|nr:ABC transporter ATP-binding protein [Acidimicrobiales bacterium]